MCVCSSKKNACVYVNMVSFDGNEFAGWQLKGCLKKSISRHVINTYNTSVFFVCGTLYEF